MGCPTFNKEITDALAKSSLNNGDLFLVSDNGTAYKVTIADLIAAIGATGTITGLNDGGAVPVLTGTAPNYIIRGIAGGNGINAQVSPEGTISVNAQVANAGGSNDGSELIKNVNANTIEYRRLRAGNGIDVTTENNRLVISNTEVAVSNNTTIISELSDFPAPSSGVITLADNTDYLIVNSISTTNRFVLGTNTVIRAVDPRITTLSYTGTGTMFTCQDGNQVIKEIGISCPNGQLFDHDGSVIGSFLMRWVLLTNVKDLGDLSKPFVGLYNLFIDTITGTKGFTYTNGSNKRLIADQITINDPTNTGLTVFDLGLSEFNSIFVSTIEMFNTLTGQVFLSGATGSANLVTNTFGSFSKVEILGNMTALDGIVYGDAGFEFSQVSNIPTTRPVALTTLDATATTIIGAIDTPVVVDGAFTSQQADYATINANGRITYLGVRNRDLAVDVVLSARPITGTSTYTFYIAKNGTVITPSGISREITSTSLGVLSLTWLVNVDTDDFIEVFVENNTSTTNCEVQKLIFRAS